MAEVVGFLRGVDAEHHAELAASGTDGEGAGSGAPSARSASPTTSNDSVPSSPSDATDSPASNCNGSTPMPMRFDRWMRSKLSASTARTPSSAVPFAAQSRDEPEPYSLPARITSGTPSDA